MIPLNVNCKTFFLANLNSHFPKKWLIFESNINIKRDAKYTLVMKGTLV